jgi:hypothetical protein
MNKNLKIILILYWILTPIFTISDMVLADIPETRSLVITDFKNTPSFEELFFTIFQKNAFQALVFTVGIWLGLKYSNKKEADKKNENEIEKVEFEEI